MRKKVIIRIFLFIMSLMTLYAIYGGARNFYWNVEYSRAADRAALYSATLISALERYQHLPFILSQDPFVINGLQAGGTQILNLRLESFARQSQVDALYILNSEGDTIAASNWQESLSFLGNNYGFRPYFKEAMEGRRGEFFAIGVTTHTPGYFVAEPIFSLEGEILGVMAMKVDLSALTKSWAEGGEDVFVINAENIVVLSSNSDWNYKSLLPLNEARKVEILKRKQFVGQDLDPLGISKQTKKSLHLGNEAYLYRQVPIDDHLGWRLFYVSEQKFITQQSRAVVLTATIILIILLAIYLLMRSERIKRELRASEADSRDLRRLNESLGREIEERRLAQEKLASTQNELRQASKLAALGQLAASVSHELGQPISAMQNYLAWADLPDNKMDEETRDVMRRLKNLVIRMGHITKQLKFFARPGSTSLNDVNLRDVLAGVREIMAPDVQRAAVQYMEEVMDGDFIIRGDRLRLEQVLINLLRNSLDAMGENGGHHLCVELKEVDNFAQIRVLDRGPGLPDNLSDSLFDSFVTTKASGKGMGLGLAISKSIIEDHGGEILARSRDSGGAEFKILLPLHKNLLI